MKKALQAIDEVYQAYKEFPETDARDNILNGIQIARCAVEEAMETDRPTEIIGYLDPIPAEKLAEEARRMAPWKSWGQVPEWI